MDLCVEEPKVIVSNLTAHSGLEDLRKSRCEEDENVGSEEDESCECL